MLVEVSLEKLAPSHSNPCEICQGAYGDGALALTTAAEQYPSKKYPVKDIVDVYITRNAVFNPLGRDTISAIADIDDCDECANAF